MEPERDARVHAWRIDPAQQARHEARRGRRHAYEHIDPTRTVLVVVDMIPFFVDENPYCRGIVPQIAALAEGVRSAGGAVAWVVPAVAERPSDWSRQFFGEEVAVAYHAAPGFGPLVERLWPGFEVHAADLVVEKEGASAFFPGRSSLAYRLAEGVETVIVTGTVTNVCVESTVRDASALGLGVILVADGCAAVDDATHNATLHTVYRSFGDVRPTSEVLALIADGHVG